MSKKILVADDEKDMVSLIVNQLRPEYNAFGALDTLQAISIIHRHHPDLLILDYKMPPADGFSLIEHLKMGEDTQDIPIIMITAYPTEELEEKLFALDTMKGYFTKPFSIEELVKRVKVVLE